MHFACTPLLPLSTVHGVASSSYHQISWLGLLSFQRRDFPAKLSSISAAGSEERIKKSVVDQIVICERVFGCSVYGMAHHRAYKKLLEDFHILLCRPRCLSVCLSVCLSKEGASGACIHAMAPGKIRTMAYG